MKNETLVKPTDFTLIPYEVLVDEFFTKVNDALKTLQEDEVVTYETADANIKVEIVYKRHEDRVVTMDMINRVCKLYKGVGWKEVIHDHYEETDKDFECDTFTFYFNTIVGTPAENMTEYSI